MPLHNGLFFPYLASVFLLLSIAASSQEASKTRSVIIMLDGFRHDYAERDAANLPTFSRMTAEGSRAEYVQPIYPSLSMPSWTTMVTGLYAEEHGMVGNTMYDVDNDRTFSVYPGKNGEAMHTDPSWYGEHVSLWATAAYQGKRVSVRYWSGCDIPAVVEDDDGQLLEVLPERCEPYRDEIGLIGMDMFSSILDDIHRDLRDGIEVVFAYTEVVDATGHRHGPDSSEIWDIVRQTDAALGKFMADLEKSNLLDFTNVVIVSDHGMTSLSEKENRFVASALSKPDVVDVAVEGMAYMFLKVKDGEDVNEVVREINELDGVRAWANKDIPDYLRFRDTPRLLDVLVYSQGPIMLKRDKRYDVPYVASCGIQYKGHHGFDDTSPVAAKYYEGGNPDMRTIFYAMGPSFKAGHTHDWIKLVDEYQIFAHISGVEGESHRGSWSRVKGMLRGGATGRQLSYQLGFVAAVVALIVHIA